MATYGEGDPTDNAQDFYDWLQEADVDLSGVKYAVSTPPPHLPWLTAYSASQEPLDPQFPPGWGVRTEAERGAWQGGPGKPPLGPHPASICSPTQLRFAPGALLVVKASRWSRLTPTGWAGSAGQGG